MSPFLIFFGAEMSPDPVTSHQHLLMEGEVQPIITGTAATHGGFQGQTSEVWAAARVRSTPQVAWFLRDMSHFPRLFQG